jgi:hypothetical protein
MKYYLLHSLTMRITIIPKLRLFNTIIIFTMLLCGCYQSAHNDKKDSPFKKTLLQKKVNGINLFTIFILPIHQLKILFGEVST